MADEIDVLLQKIDDPTLRSELSEHIGRLRAKRDFGLVYKDHLPERVRLPDHPLRRGTKAVRRAGSNDDIYVVRSTSNGRARLVDADGVQVEMDIVDLVVVVEFREPIYPGLTHLASIRRGGDKPSHVVINAENHHALEMLRYTHAGKVDCIYIDPPYNTGAKDWKYDNDYVDAEDVYRHSKWLAFMQRRLELARELLNPDDSVLIVTIDEKECLRLGLLLQQTFPTNDVQMVSTVMNPAGSARVGRFTRVDEYAFFVFLGDAVAQTTGLNFTTGEWSTQLPSLWFSATRNGIGQALRANRSTPVLFYPVHVDAESGLFHSVGEPLTQGLDRASYAPPTGTVAIWPVSSAGREQTWRFSAARMAEFFEAGTARLGKRNASTGHRPITYLQPGTLELIAKGVYRVVGRGTEGELLIEMTGDAHKPSAPPSVWNVPSHFAREYGSKLVAALLPGRVFPYPKSLYAVEDAVRVATMGKPDALVLDFFAGSGTTTHAVMRLNRQDGGRRQSISVTNNEVSLEEARQLAEQGHRDGDPAWEALGIFEYITRPRITAAVTGQTYEGAAVHGDYKFTDASPMADGFEENVDFLHLTYQDPLSVELDDAFEAVAPLLWLKAGGCGPVIESRRDGGGQQLPFATTGRYGILFDPDQWRRFLDELTESISTVFIVTDSPSTFAGVAGALPMGVEPVRLYESYLQTFRFGNGR